MWRFNEALIETASRQEIIDAVNLLAKSPWFGYDRDFSSLLGGIIRNSTGHIVSAETAQMIWSIRVPDDVEIVDNQGSGLELELADAVSLEFECNDRAHIPHSIMEAPADGFCALADACAVDADCR